MFGIFKLRQFEPDIPPTTMEQEPLLYCRDCKSSKSRDQFNSCQRDDKHGAKGEPTSKCTDCVMRNQQRRQITKRKRDEEGPNPSEGPSELDPVLSMEEFSTLLPNQALEGNLCCRACVSTQEMDDDDAEKYNVIAGHMWEATGFRFRFVCFPLEVQWLMFPAIQTTATKKRNVVLVF